MEFVNTYVTWFNQLNVMIMAKAIYHNRPDPGVFCMNIKSQMSYILPLTSFYSNVLQFYCCYLLEFNNNHNNNKKINLQTNWLEPITAMNKLSKKK